MLTHLSSRHSRAWSCYYFGHPVLSDRQSSQFCLDYAAQVCHHKRLENSSEFFDLILGVHRALLESCLRDRPCCYAQYGGSLSPRPERMQPHQVGDLIHTAICLRWSDLFFSISDLWNSSQTDRVCHSEDWEARIVYGFSGIGILIDLTLMALPIGSWVAYPLALQPLIRSAANKMGFGRLLDSTYYQAGQRSRIAEEARSCCTR